MNWLWWFFRWYFRIKPGPATYLTTTYIGRNNNMVEFRLGWIQATKSFAIRQDIIASINIGADQPLATGLGMTANSFLREFNVGESVSWFVRTYGDNGTHADSARHLFTADNLEQVDAATGLTATFIQHIP